MMQMMYIGFFVQLLFIITYIICWIILILMTFRYWNQELKFINNILPLFHLNNEFLWFRQHYNVNGTQHSFKEYGGNLKLIMKQISSMYDSINMGPYVINVICNYCSLDEKYIALLIWEFLDENFKYIELYGIDNHTVLSFNVNVDEDDDYDQYDETTSFLKKQC
eukprot:527861_1